MFRTVLDEMIHLCKLRQQLEQRAELHLKDNADFLRLQKIPGIGPILALTILAGAIHSEILFVATAVLAIFFWGPLFSLFPATIGQYFGEAAAGSNYGVLYAIAKGSGGFYGGVLSAILINQHGFPVAMGAAAAMAVCAGLLIIPLKGSPPVWREEEVIPRHRAAA